MGLLDWFKCKDKTEIVKPIDKILIELRDLVQITYFIIGSSKTEDWFRITNLALDKIDCVKTQEESKKVEVEVTALFINTLKNNFQRRINENNLSFNKATKEQQKRILELLEEFPVISKGELELYNSFLKIQKEIMKLTLHKNKSIKKQI